MFNLEMTGDNPEKKLKIVVAWMMCRRRGDQIDINKRPL